MSARSVKLWARGMLALGVVVFMLWALGPYREPGRALIPWDGAYHFIAFYGFTGLGFLSFPKTRRTDIAQLVALAAIVFEVGRTLPRPPDLAWIAADAFGVVAVLLTSFTEQMRKRARDYPHGPALSSGRRRRGRAADARAARAAARPPGFDAPAEEPAGGVLLIAHDPSPPR